MCSPPPLWEVPSLTLAGMCLKGEAAWGALAPGKERRAWGPDYQVDREEGNQA